MATNESKREEKRYTEEELDNLYKGESIHHYEDANGTSSHNSNSSSSFNCSAAASSSSSSITK